MLLNYSGSERRRDTPARVEIQLLEPACDVRISFGLCGVPAAVHRRRKQRRRRADLRLARVADDGPQILDKGVGWTIRPRRWRRVAAASKKRLQGTLHADRCS